MAKAAQVARRNTSHSESNSKVILSVPLKKPEKRRELSAIVEDENESENKRKKLKPTLA
jgi:hypothetical protein